MAYRASESGEVQLRLGRICRRTYFFVDLPSMILAIGCLGVSLLILKHPNWKAGWLHMKLTFAFFLVICDLILASQIFKIAEKPSRNAFFYKILHGLVGIFLIGILAAIYILKQRAL